MKSKLLPTALLILVAIAIPQRAKAPPPISGQDLQGLPGTPIGEARSYWLAPYVRVSEQGIRRQRTKSVTWYSEDGSAKTLAVLYDQPGFVEVKENGKMIVMGVSEPWRCELRKKPDLGMKAFRGKPLAATPDSRTLIDTTNPDDHGIALDVYVHGVSTRTIGPFVQHGVETYEMNEDGSTAMMVWKDASKTTPQIICADRDGNIRFRVDCDGSGDRPIPAPDGVGALLHYSQPKGQKYACYTRDGKGHTLEMTGNEDCIGWVPGTLRSLFSKSIGYDSRYHMIDWDSGQEAWEIPCPGGVQVLATTITPRLVIFAVAEWYQPGPWSGSGWVFHEDKKELIRAFYAVRAEDGRLVARWQAHYPRRYADRGWERFVKLGEKLYFLNEDEVTELSEDDILAGKNGWKPGLKTD